MSTNILSRIIRSTNRVARRSASQILRTNTIIIKPSRRSKRRTTLTKNISISKRSSTIILALTFYTKLPRSAISTSITKTFINQAITIIINTIQDLVTARMNRRIQIITIIRTSIRTIIICSISRRNIHSNLIIRTNNTTKNSIRSTRRKTIIILIRMTQSNTTASTRASATNIRSIDDSKIFFVLLLQYFFYLFFMLVKYVRAARYCC